MPRKSKSKGRRQRRREELGLLGIPRPPSFTSTVALQHAFRWSGGGGAYTIDTDNLLSLMVVATGATTSARIFQSVRMRRIKIWCAPPALGSAPNTIACEFIVGGNSDVNFAPSSQWSDQTMGAQMAYLDIPVPKGALAGFWLQNGMTNTSVMNLVLATGSVVEIHFDLRLIDQETAVSGPSLTGATTGRVYGRYLGSSANAPVGLTVTP